MGCFNSQSVRDMIGLDRDIQSIDGDYAHTSKKTQVFPTKQQISRKNV